MTNEPDIAPAVGQTLFSGSGTLPDAKIGAEALEMANVEKSADAAMKGDGEDQPEKGDDTLHLATKSHEELQHVTGFRLISIIISLLLAVFCVALDNTIIATAIPRITDNFHTIDDVGWYGSAYLLTTCAFQLLYAKFYTFFNVKTVFLVALSIFEVGSLVCGVAPTSTALIVGRAVAGVGSAGLFTGATTAVAQVAPMGSRPVIIGIIGGLFGFCSIIGPLLGGALTDRATWRWCFYINLPIGAVTAIGILIFLHVDQQLEKVDGGAIARIMRFDPLGNVLFICAVICLLLALQWGGTTYDWSNGRIIALFVLFAVLFIAFVAMQVWQGENATIPSRVARQRTIRFGALFALCIGSTVFIMVYYLPIWFQAIHGDDAVTSAVHLLPLILSQLAGTIVAGGMTTRIGYYMPFVWASVVFMPIGAGLLTTCYVGIPAGRWIGYQILFGLGLGFGFQQANVAAQASLPLKDIPTGVAVVFSAQFLGGAVFVSVGENVFTNRLRSNIAALKIPEFGPALAVRVGATELRDVVPPAYLHDVLVAYNGAIVRAFQVALILSCLTVLGASGMEWRSIKRKKSETNA
ncbi:MAG: hypothetical protein M1830_002013 [Pleopsidium flavum]|nr:MAG: hypothetical protein M1830_002013 [Pleopsidium flavum]